MGGLDPVFYGTPEEVADEIERWVDISGVDGFNFTFAIYPGTFEDIVDSYFEKAWFGLGSNPSESHTFQENVFGMGDDDPIFVRPSHPAYEL